MQKPSINYKIVNLGILEDQIDYYERKVEGLKFMLNSRSKSKYSFRDRSHVSKLQAILFSLTSLKYSLERDI